MMFILEPFSCETFPCSLTLSHNKENCILKLKIPQLISVVIYNHMLKFVYGFSLFSPDSHIGVNQNFHRFVISSVLLITQNVNTACDYFVSSTNHV